MTITAEATEHVTKINGQPVRAWKAKTEKGVECIAFIAFLTIGENQDASEFEAALSELPPPVEATIPEILVIELRHVI